MNDPETNAVPYGAIKATWVSSESTTIRRTGNMAPLYAALAKAQSDWGEIPKSAKNPHFGNFYSTLEDIQAGTHKALAANGLCVIMLPHDNENGDRFLTSILAHATGASIEADMMVLPKGGGNIQTYGSHLTYCRRYTLKCLLNVNDGQDDDDGEVAIQQPPKRQAPPVIEPKASETRRAEPSKPQPKPAPKPEPKPPEVKQPELPGTPPKPPPPPPPKPLSDRPPPPKVDAPPTPVQAPAIDPLKQLQQLALGKGFTMKGLRWACYQNIGRPEVYYPPAMTPDEVAKMLDIVGKMTREEAAEHCASVKDLEPPIKEGK